MPTRRPAYPFPGRLFAEGRSVGAAVGYAHFDGSMIHSTLPLDLALGGVDFIEVFQFGELKADRWYELLNAGFRASGIAGSDFPANLSRFKPWPRAIPLLGPERTLVKAHATKAGDPGRSAYDAWVEGVRSGAVVVSNGPLLDLVVEGRGPGAIVDLTGARQQVNGEARAVSHRALESLEVVANGRVVQSIDGDGRQTELRLPFALATTGSLWVAARVRARRQVNEPVIQAHSNPVYLLRDRRPVHDKAARQAVAERWKPRRGLLPRRRARLRRPRAAAGPARQARPSHSHSGRRPRTLALKARSRDITHKARPRRTESLSGLSRALRINQGTAKINRATWGPF